MQKIKAIIFDLDGTLGNTLPLCIKAFKSSVEPLINRVVPDEEIIATFGPSEEGTIMKLVPEHYEKGLAGYLHQYKILHSMCPHPFDGIKELLIYLQGKSVKLAMVTGKGKHSTDISLQYFNIEPFFEIVETGSVNGPRKTEGIQCVLKNWPGIQKDEIVYVGDAVSDIEASRKAGVPVIAAAWAETADPDQLKQYTPDRIFYTVADFSRWVYSVV